jgi:2-polyprenyl-3-methyl-5-hydroxy-6-metoxy-1,4-benzoquinol methylase
MEPSEAIMTEHANAVAKTWSDYWETSGMRPDRSLRGRLLRRYMAAAGGMSSARYTLGILKRVLGDLRGLTVLDAGSGTGLNSLALAARGARVTLLDIAPQALAIAKTYYDEQGLEATLVSGSIFALPFEDETFDVVWNTGVIEHFEPAERRLAVHEMLRVMKRDGTLITINPNARARIYRFAKEWAERHGRWDVGFELPIDTLADDVSGDRYTIDETDEGWLMELHFLKLFLPRSLRIPYAAAHEVVQNVLPFLNRLPGYLKVSVIRLRPDQRSAAPVANH